MQCSTVSALTFEKNTFSLLQCSLLFRELWGCLQSQVREGGEGREFIGITATTDCYYTGNMHHLPQRSSQDMTFWSQAAYGLVALCLRETKVFTFNFSIRATFQDSYPEKFKDTETSKRKTDSRLQCSFIFGFISQQKLVEICATDLLTAAEQVQGKSGRHIQIGQSFNNFGIILKAAQLICLKSTRESLTQQKSLVARVQNDIYQNDIYFEDFSFTDSTWKFFLKPELCLVSSTCISVTIM